MVRKDWKNLNGLWDYAITPASLPMMGEADGQILVPFCVESSLSGVGRRVGKDEVLWYRTTIASPESWEKTLLHFDAVDWAADVYVNGELALSHTGGYTAFSLDVTEALKNGPAEIAVRVFDPTDDPAWSIPRGKQVCNPNGIWYTPVTGIWQTVWLEFVPQTHVEKVRYTVDEENGSVTIAATLAGSGTLRAEAYYEGEPMGSAQVCSSGGQAILTVKLKETHLWEVGQGRLYDLILTYGEDRVKSYFGLRSVRLEGYRFLLNGKSVFQRLILDQGFYPDGIYTAPSDRELQADIERSMAMGFNGARLHEKIFEERFLYHCDRMGYLVWGEFPNWGLDASYSDSIYGILPEWIEEIERDFNHPAIVGWCPFNETWDEKGRKQDDEVLETVYKVTKALDSTRPCIDTSGNFHVATDIFDVHDYEQDPGKFAASYRSLPIDGTFYDRFAERQKYRKGQPMFVSEYGGIRWTKDQEGWGYGVGPATEQEFLERLKGLTDALLDNRCMLGLCYTQLTDVEQEQNGLYTYDRKPKFDPTVIHAIFARKAAIEEEDTTQAE